MVRRRFGGAIKTVTVLTILAFAIACDFFVDPVLTGMSVGPAATIQSGTTLQMNAVGTFNDGSQQALKSGVFWTSGSPTVAVIDSAGLVKAIAPGQAIISGSRETVTASATVTVTLGGITSIQVSTMDGLSSIRYGSTEQFVATANAGGQQIDVTNSVTWSTNPRSVPNVSIAPNSGLLTTTSGPTTSDQFLVVALDPTTGILGQMNFTVHP